MRILVLDDDDVRHEYFARQFANHDILHVHTYSECLNALLNNDWYDVVFLDHDLNDHGYRSVADERANYFQRSLTRFSRPGLLDGRDVVEDMVKMLPPEKVPSQVVVHSWNDAGGAEMMSMLNDAGYNALRWVFDPSKTIKING